MEQKKIDMTTGPIMKNVFLFAIPIVLGNILQYLYTTVDTLVIGNYCGKTSLAAVGTSAQPVEVLLCIFLGIGTGVSILVSQYVGGRDMKKMRRAVDTATFFVFVCGIPLCILGYFVAPLILRGMGVPGDTWDAAVTYTRIVFFGTLGNIGYNMNAGILRGMGDSMASLWFLVVSCIANIVLDFLFVAGFGMDVGGVALSTTLAMYLSWIISIVYIRKKFPELELSYYPKTFDANELKQFVKIGLPIGLNNSLYSLGHVAIQTLVNAQGSTFMAGASVAGRVTGMANIAITALSSAATTFSGQNYGASNFDRLRRGYIIIPVISGVVTLAAGLVRYTTVVNILMLWAVRIPSAYLINQYFDGTYIMLCFPISFSFGMIMMIGYYIFSRKWQEIIRTGL